MNSLHERLELAELIQRELDGVLESHEFARLQDLLDASPAAVKYYFRTILAVAAFSAPSVVPLTEDQHRDSGLLTDSCWEALAAEEISSPGIHLSSPEPPPELIRNISHEKLMGSLKKSTIISIAANVAAILLLVFFIQYAPIRGKSFAYVLDTYQTADQSGELRAGQYLDGKLVKLDRGLLKFQMNDGTVAVLEGPSEMCLEGDDQLFLIKGKLTVHVPQEAIGFTVRTPSASVIDYGTDFAVKVDQYAVTEAHVLKGNIKFGLGSNPRILERTLRLSANQAGRVAGRRLVEIPAGFSEFAFDVPSRFENTARTLGVSMYLHVQSDSLASFKDKMYLAPSQMEINPKATVVPGPFADQGLKSYALHVEKSESAVKITDTQSIPQSSNGAFSIGYWIRFDSIGRQLVSYNRVDTSQGTHYRSVTMTADGHLQHSAHNAAVSQQWRIVQSPEPLKAGRWYFVLISRGLNSDNTKRMYINGKRVAENVIERDLISLDPFDNFQFGGTVGGLAGFSGDIAEILLFSKALNDREVKMLYESAGNNP
jgi:hypothetical protein